MLTTTEKRYIDICVAQISSAKTNQELADQFGVARTCVDRAIRWGRERDLHVLDTTEKLRAHLQEFGAALRLAECYARTCNRRSRKAIRIGKESSARTWVRVGLLALDRVKDYRTRIMELEGIYKHVLNLQHTGAGGGPMRILYEAVQPDPQPGQN